jgi:hypothetical protein
MTRFWRAVLCGVVTASTVAIAVGGTAAAGADSDSTGDAGRELARSIPADQRYQCFIADPTSVADVGATIAAASASIVVELECGPSGPADFVAYLKMSSNEAMNKLYLQYVPGAQNAPTRSEEGKCPSEGQWQLDGTDVGRVACFFTTSGSDGTTIPETVVRVWTYDRENIFAIASPFAGDADAVGLRKWWTENAGPLKDPVDAPGITSGSASALRRSQTALKSQIPKPIRSSCTATERADERDRVWTAAEFLCSPASGTGVGELFYGAVDPEVIDNVFAFTKPDEGTEDGTCPDSGTFTVGKGKAKRTVGEFACTMLAGTTPQEAIRYTWSDRKRGIIMYAYGSDADKLNKFVNSGAGDPVDASTGKKGKGGS